MYIDIIAPVVTLVCAERENQQFGFQGGNLGDTVRMSKSKASSTVHSLVYVGDCSECFYQSGTRSLRIDMSTHMAIADMNNTDRIFRQAGTHLAEPFKYGSQ